ncbi:uncharacterized protein LOC126772637 [Nymphalis io]|uniref:uncharacterized protein LOC126772637 n=1 Tax=Inachis io TaxID=171585 RepID=UPI0021676597|nr:uncharacterized protein LOC126772637 [Nymphalis io]
MCSNLEIIMKIGAFTVFTYNIWSVYALDETEQKAGMIEPNRTPLLQRRDFEESELLKNNYDQRLYKRSVRAESSSKSEENVDDKVIEGLNDNIKKARESELSDDADSSDSRGDRRLSTKGFLPDDFERESNSKIHGRYSKESEER